MNRLRLATQEEVDKIKDQSDLAPGSYVMALDTAQGTVLGVIRPVVEVDPVFFPEEMSNKQKYLFIRDIETHLAAKGVPCYYFNIEAGEHTDKYRETMQHYGAEQVSSVPELRFLKQL